ncbi:MAG: polyprenyl diphosphate synthase [Candidatus Hodarchaeota archaeon]
MYPFHPRFLLWPVFRIYEKVLWRQIRDLPPPKHIGIIMDGNRRWEKKMRKEPGQGHIHGSKKIEDILKWCWEAKVQIVTLYAFSTENFNRPEDEIRHLMELAADYFVKVSTDKYVHQYKVRLKTIGRKEMLPLKVQEAIQKAEEATENYSDYTLQIAIAYGGRAELVDAIRQIVEQVQQGDIEIDCINEKIVGNALYTNGTPDPDLIIRTSGEERLSGFLLWQSAYSELFFTDVYFPTFRKIDLWRAIRTFQRRERRYGS